MTRAVPRSSRLTGKKLTFAGGPAGGSGDGFFLEDPSPANDALDRQMRRQSMDGTLPVSLAALQVVPPTSFQMRVDCYCLCLTIDLDSTWNCNVHY